MAKELNIEKIIKKVRDDANKDMKRHIGSVFEEFQSRVSGIGEQYGDIQKTLKSHTNMIGKLATDITEVQSNIKELRADMMEVKSDVKNIKFNIKMDLDQKIDRKHFVDLDTRVRKLEKK